MVMACGRLGVVHGGDLLQVMDNGMLRPATISVRAHGILLEAFWWVLVIGYLWMMFQYGTTVCYR